MPHNTLFNFINTHRHVTTSALEAGVRVVEAVDSKGTAYFRFELPTHSAPSLRDAKHIYSLRDHHISVYATEDSRLADLSQYHYTARYLDDTGVLYKIHVYFNGYEEMVKEPVLSKIISGAGGDSVVTLAVAEEFSAFFTDAARTHSNAIVGRLRCQLEATVKEYLARYKSLELEAFELAKWLACDVSPYLLKLREMASTLEHILPLVQYDHHASIYKFLQQMIVGISKQSPILRGEAAGAGAVDAVAAKAEEEIAPECHAAHEDSKKTIEPAVVLDESINTLISQYSAVNKEDETALAHTLSATLCQIYELSLQLSEPKVFASPSALDLLHQLHNELLQTGEKLFIRALLRNNSAALNVLPAFYHLINERHLSLALQTANPQLLDFLLAHGDFAINKQPITIKGTTYPTAVHFCYEKDTEETPLAPCLAVLIKHKASILLNDSRGLPIAQGILSQVAHPLRKALLTAENKEQTVHSIPFYKKLIQTLQNYMKKNKLTPEEAGIIERDIAVYTNQVKALAARPEGSSKIMADSSLLEDYMGPSIMERLYKDPDYIAQTKILKETEDSYFSLLTKEEQKAKKRANDSSLKSILGHVSRFTSISRLFTFEAVKSLGLEQIQASIARVEVNKKLYINTKKLEARNTPNKVRKQLERERPKLLSQLKELEGEELTESALKKAAEFAKKFGKLTAAGGIDSRTAAFTLDKSGKPVFSMRLFPPATAAVDTVSAGAGATLGGT